MLYFLQQHLALVHICTSAFKIGSGKFPQLRVQEIDLKFQTIHLDPWHTLKKRSWPTNIIRDLQETEEYCFFHPIVVVLAIGHLKPVLRLPTIFNKSFQQIKFCLELQAELLINKSNTLQSQIRFIKTSILRVLHIYKSHNNKSFNHKVINKLSLL